MELFSAHRADTQRDSSDKVTHRDWPRTGCYGRC